HSTAQHSTSYNSARNIISGYTHFKSDITTFSHRKTAHDAGINYALLMGFSYFKPFRRHL
ncbi:MAG: hypothetical protein IJJ70_09120, partial [Treponema sp.]|nr:hypothetical protein [Treponema sp.]